ncbi:hypothetical protein P691DRAFT_789855 [Macrolepiota fuliginosa MF-IS2]|uniref:Uncharacterized protein n=1 Tax=Macrolepiota fuliginosa MF-IS2 TaxID=1400762 RepID=A0A9P5X2N7_9AGAR|nr:hypothetical protein P691DRAFT_789855 [Macrolepiota fuliginosa MF-IS2]
MKFNDVEIVGHFCAFICVHTVGVKDIKRRYKGKGLWNREKVIRKRVRIAPSGLEDSVKKDRPSTQGRYKRELVASGANVVHSPGAAHITFRQQLYAAPTTGGECRWCKSRLFLGFGKGAFTKISWWSGEVEFGGNELIWRRFLIVNGEVLPPGCTVCERDCIRQSLWSLASSTPN